MGDLDEHLDFRLLDDREVQNRLLALHVHLKNGLT